MKEDLCANFVLQYLTMKFSSVMIGLSNKYAFEHVVAADFFRVKAKTGVSLHNNDYASSSSFCTVEL